MNGKTATLVKDIIHSQEVVTSPEGRRMTFQKDPDTLLIQSVGIPGLFARTYSYDVSGRRTSVDIESRSATFTYDEQGFLESFTNPENHTYFYTRDAVGRIIGVNRPDSSTLSFTYDKNGNMTVLTNPLSVEHGFGYSTVNRIESYQAPISGVYSYVYDKDRRIIQKNFPSGRHIKFIYDKTRLSRWETPEGNIEYTYHCGAKVESITKGSESIVLDYDGKLLTSVSLNGILNQSREYGYNNDFNVASFTYAGVAEHYTRDNDGLLTGAGRFAINRNAENGMPEGVSDGKLDIALYINEYGELSSINAAVDNQAILSWSLERNAGGRITRKSETVNGVTTDYEYGYDAMGRLITVQKDAGLVEEYRYDLNGARIYEMNAMRGIAGRAMTYSDEDHLLTVGDVGYQYDYDGFLATRTHGADVATYRYSSRGELLSVTLPDSTLVEYEHDPVGRRISKMIDGVVVEKYLWKGVSKLLAVYDGSGNLLMRFEYAGGRAPIVMSRGGETYYLLHDQVGSLRIVADTAGNVVKRIDYDSFGNIISDSNQAFTTPFGFAGGLHDRDVGLVRFGYRDYDPYTGRWTAKDPIFFAAGDTDLYGYCVNSPINLVDPDGLESFEMDGNRARINGKWVEATKSYRHCHLYVDEKNNAYLWGRGDDFEDSLYGEADDDWWDYLEQDDLNDQPRIETFDPEELKFPTPEKKDDGITEEDIENHSCCD